MAQPFDNSRIMEEKLAVAALAALAQEARLRVFRQLVGAGPSGATPGSLLERLDIAPTTLSFHLKTLANADLIAPERAGRQLVYRVRFDTMRALMDYLTAHCCAGAPCDAVDAICSTPC